MLMVYKYTKELTDIMEFDLPTHAQILRIDSQSDGKDNVIALWAAVNPKTEYRQIRRIRIAGTGHPIDEEKVQLAYINTFTIMNKKLWFHAFEIL
jgi:hypothetical protein